MPSKKKVIDPDKVFSDKFRKGKIPFQRITKTEWAAYVSKYGNVIYTDKPSIWNGWSKGIKRTLLVKSYPYTNILEVSIYHAGDYIKCKKEEELNRIIGVSEED